MLGRGRATATKLAPSAPSSAKHSQPRRPCARSSGAAGLAQRPLAWPVAGVRRRADAAISVSRSHYLRRFARAGPPPSGGVPYDAAHSAAGRRRTPPRGGGIPWDRRSASRSRRASRKAAASYRLVRWLVRTPCAPRRDAFRHMDTGRPMPHGAAPPWRGWLGASALFCARLRLSALCAPGAGSVPNSRRRWRAERADPVSSHRRAPCLARVFVFRMLSVPPHRCAPVWIALRRRCVPACCAVAGARMPSVQ